MKLEPKVTSIHKVTVVLWGTIFPKDADAIDIRGQSNLLGLFIHKTSQP